MNDIRSEEQEQIDAIKSWLQEHALSLAAAVLVFCGVFFGPDLWQSYKNNQVWPISDSYEQFNEAVVRASSGSVATDSELQLVDKLADELSENHGDSYYAFLASLSAARLNAQLGNFEAAKARLEWAESHTSNEADEQLVNLRLALVEAELGNTESALSRLKNPNEQFASLYAEARGDINNSQGQREQAIEAYEEAIATALDDNSAQIALIDAKLQNLLTGLGSMHVSE